MTGSDVAQACGARGKVKGSKKPNKTCGGKKCFAAGTLVHTQDGLKPIEQIVPGDMVKSMDTVTGEIAYKAVTEIHTNQFDPVGQVTLLDETDGSETILSVTATHPFYSVKGEWVHASQLRVGEELIEDGGEILTVVSVIFNRNAKPSKTHNITVSDNHTYFVGKAGVLVHNGFGAYIVTDIHTFYVGKGDVKRMNISGRSHFGKGRFQSFHLPACSNRESLKLEHDLMTGFFRNGVNHPRDVPSLLNKILSPGAKY